MYFFVFLCIIIYGIIFNITWEEMWNPNKYLYLYKVIKNKFEGGVNDKRIRVFYN